jgi:hypothetical protein
MATSAKPSDWDSSVPEVPATRGDGGDASPRPARDIGPHSSDYPLSGPLGATEPGALPTKQDDGKTFSTFPRFEGDTPASRKAFTAKARKVTRPSGS